MESKDSKDFVKQMTKLFSQQKDIKDTLINHFDLYLSVVNFMLIYHHLSDSVTTENEKIQLKELPFLIVDKWKGEVIAEMKAEEERLKSSPANLFGPLFDSKELQNKVLAKLEETVKDLKRLFKEAIEQPSPLK